MALSNDDYDDFIADVGTNAETFTYAEADRIYTRLAAAENETIRLGAMKAVYFERLLNSASRLHDYTAGAVGEELSQIVKNLEARYKAYLPYLTSVGTFNNEVVISKIGKRSHAERREPDA